MFFLSLWISCHGRLFTAASPAIASLQGETIDLRSAAADDGNRPDAQLGGLGTLRAAWNLHKASLLADRIHKNESDESYN